MIIDLGQEEYSCPMCAVANNLADYKVSSREFEDHLIFKHNWKSCDNCDKHVFETQEQLNDHCWTTMCAGSIECPANNCWQKYNLSDEKSLYKHVVKEHRFTHYCKVKNCPFVGETDVDLEEHYKESHISLNNMFCPSWRCGQLFKDNKDLLLHKNKNHAMKGCCDTFLNGGFDHTKITFSEHLYGHGGTLS